MSNNDDSLILGFDTVFLADDEGKLLDGGHGNWGHPQKSLQQAAWSQIYFCPNIQ